MKTSSKTIIFVAAIVLALLIIGCNETEEEESAVSVEATEFDSSVYHQFMHWTTEIDADTLEIRIACKYFCGKNRSCGDPSDMLLCVEFCTSAPHRDCLLDCSLNQACYGWWSCIADC